MLDTKSAGQLLAMLRRGRPTRDIARRALREFPDLAALEKRLGASRLDRARVDLGRWIASTIADKPMPPHVRGLWLAVSISVEFLKKPPPEVFATPLGLDAGLHLHELAGDGAPRDPPDGLAGAGPPAPLPGPEPVLGLVGEVGVRGTIPAPGG
jgi:hypothetical protein